jgi:hypothetical protein
MHSCAAAKPIHDPERGIVVTTPITIGRKPIPEALKSTRRRRPPVDQERGRIAEVAPNFMRQSTVVQTAQICIKHSSRVKSAPDHCVDCPECWSISVEPKLFKNRLHNKRIEGIVARINSSCCRNDPLLGRRQPFRRQLLDHKITPNRRNHWSPIARATSKSLQRQVPTSILAALIKQHLRSIQPTRNPTTSPVQLSLDLAASHHLPRIDTLIKRFNRLTPVVRRLT